MKKSVRHTSQWSRTDRQQKAPLRPPLVDRGTAQGGALDVGEGLPCRRAWQGNLPLGSISTSLIGWFSAQLPDWECHIAFGCGLWCWILKCQYVKAPVNRVVGWGHGLYLRCMSHHRCLTDERGAVASDVRSDRMWHSPDAAE